MDNKCNCSNKTKIRENTEQKDLLNRFMYKDYK